MPVPTADFLALPLVLCAAVLLVSGVAKLRAPEAGRDAFTSLRLPAWLASSPAPTLLPWGELALAAWLVLVPAGPLLVVGCVLALGLFLAYLAIIARALGFDEPVRCSCFGELGEDGVSRRTLARNVLLVLAALLALAAALSGLSVPTIVASAPWSTLGWLAMAGLAVCVFVLALGRGGSTESTPASDLVEGRMLPGFTLLDAVTSDAVVPAHLPDQQTLLLFLSPGCGPCERVAAELASWREATPAVAIRPVLNDRRRGDVATWADGAVAAGALLDPLGNVATLNGFGFPTALLLDGRGTLAAPVTSGFGPIEALVRGLGDLGTTDAAVAAPEASTPEADPVEAEPEDYVRTPIPRAVVLADDTSPRTLHELARQKAVLLVSTTCHCGGSDEAVRRAASWQERVPAIDVAVLTRLDADGLDRSMAGAVPVLYDHDGTTQAALAMHGSPQAVLLGADGLLAGGPVTGLDEIEQFVTDIEDQLG